MTTARIPTALTIAGSDSSGGAGIQADLKTFTALGIYGASVITALTAQNTLGVQAVAAVEPGFVRRQIASVMDDLDVRAIKTGMLANAGVVAAVVDGLAARQTNRNAIPLVVDPVMVATSGDSLLQADAIGIITRRLFPLASVVTPNLPEAARLLGTSEARTTDEAIDQARAILQLGPGAVLVKGGHGRGSEAVDVLVNHSGIELLTAERIATHNTHGTGCTLSAALAAGLADGLGLIDACRCAKAFVSDALRSGAVRPVGHGHGPVDHIFAIRNRRRQ
ncbi:MAG TPA: bifunctional hydroxymethylpyrimidine kinase/phosphomethylpyrimidine kinase [Hyphomicrobiaceae bacterium]|nr:bifunctional hydroxymethylpyrimidine kinase/phosphomethylpyrimidine kinase [Hyphomicrobiaceae bacterium]